MAESSKSAGAGAFAAPNAIPKAKAPPLKSYSNGTPLSLPEPIAALGLTKFSVLSILGVAESDEEVDISALILKYLIKSEYKSYLLLEMPNYKIPLWKNVVFSVFEKSKAFVLGAGKIILAVSIILWVLGSHGPQPTFGDAEEQVLKEYNFFYL